MPISVKLRSRGCLDAYVRGGLQEVNAHFAEDTFIRLQLRLRAQKEKLEKRGRTHEHYQHSPENNCTFSSSLPAKLYWSNWAEICSSISNSVFNGGKIVQCQGCAMVLNLTLLDSK
jgi:hypothetical protein